MQTRNEIELLSPAKDLECALTALRCGADAIYIGAEAFSARHAAANDLSDIETLVNEAHTVGARVYITLNTLLFDNEVEQARQLAWKLYNIGVDALIIQDTALLCDGMPPIELHASTQMDNRTVDKVLFWQNIGLRQVVLARELSENEIKTIAKATTVRLECFVHGALCVSYSGQCFMSYAACGRSANRGQCAQMCRHIYTLSDKNGNTLQKGHLLSLKDFNQTNNIEKLIDAGVSSFKIEGRLKDKEYVANVTLHYRKIIDEILARRPDLRRASSGVTIPNFEPNVYKSFNRGFTTYFFNGRQAHQSQPLTPKSMGEWIGNCSRVEKNSFTIDGKSELHNGDGLLIVHKNGETSGLRANKVDGQRVTPLKMIRMQQGDKVYRNSDAAFEATLKHENTHRCIPIDIRYNFDGQAFSININDADGVHTEIKRTIPSEQANNPTSTCENAIRQLSKTGGTIYTATVEVTETAANRHVAASDINMLRRDALEMHSKNRIEHFKPADCKLISSNIPFPQQELMRSGNVTNKEAKQFYESHGCKVNELGYECQQENRGQIVMTTKFCLMHERGTCLKQHPEMRSALPHKLSDDSNSFVVNFDCKNCQMIITMP